MLGASTPRRHEPAMAPRLRNIGLMEYNGAGEAPYSIGVDFSHLGHSVIDMGWFRPQRLQRYAGRLRVSLSRVSAAVLVMAVLAGCGSSDPIPAAFGRGPQGTPQLHLHANGLQLSVYETYQVRPTPVGFVIEPAGNPVLRQPIIVDIQLLASRPKAIGYRFSYLGSGRILWYSVTHEETGGSGGAVHTLIAFEHVGNRWIRYAQERQSEDEIFELWEIAQGVRYVPSS
jgi:hypothetical protein